MTLTLKGLQPLTRVDATGLRGVVNPKDYGAFADGTSHAITSDDISAHSEWIGTYAAGDQWDYVGIQEAIYAAYGTNRTNASGLWINNQTLFFPYGDYLINKELKCYHLIGFRWEGDQKFGTRITQGTTNKRIVDGQSVAYGVFSNLCFSTSASQNLPLVDLDYDGSQGSDLRPQNITFYDCYFQGNNLGYIGPQIAKSGGGAQGDNIRFYNCYISGFLQAGGQLGGGADDVATAFAYNAIDVKFISGDIQSCPKYGLAAYGGNWIVENTSFENSTTGAAEQTGYDILGNGSQRSNSAKNCRSESTRFSKGVEILENISVNPNLQSWYNSNGGGSLAGTALSLNQAFTGTTIGGDGKVYKVTTAGTLGGLGLTAVASAGASTLTVAGTPWTINAFAGYKVSIISGTGAPTNLSGGVADGQLAQSIVIASNTNNTLTLASPWSVQPDATSQFVIEPDWGTQTTSGSVTFALMDYFVAVGPLTITGSRLVGGKISLGVAAKVEGLEISRADAFAVTGSTNGPYDGFSLTKLNNIFLIGGPQNGVAPGVIRKWFIPSHGGDIGGTLVKDYAQFNLGVQKVVWSGAASSDPNNRYRDLFIGRGDGIRADSGSAITRNVLAIGGTLGRETPVGTNQAGSAIHIQGGLSTGTGVPGGIEFWDGTVGSSGAAVNSGSKLATLKRADGLLLEDTIPFGRKATWNSSWAQGSVSEEITLNTGGTTTDSAVNMLPANSIIEAAVAVVSVTITTATSVQIGDATTANRFISSFPGMGAGNKSAGLNHRKGSVTTDAAGPTQTSAAKIRITTDVNPGAGKIRVVVFYSQFVAPDA